MELNISIPYSHFSIFETWAIYLSEKLNQAKFLFAQSYDKDTLTLNFKLSSGILYNLEVKFVLGELYFFESESGVKRSTKLKSQFQFKEIDSEIVSEVKFRKFDRLICIEFQNGFQLWFKGFGRFGNVLLIEKNTNQIESIFRLNIKADWDIDVQMWNSESQVENEFQNSMKIHEFWGLEKYVNLLNFQLRDDNKIHISKSDKSQGIDIIINNLIELSKQQVQSIYFNTFKQNFIEQKSKESQILKVAIDKYSIQVENIENRRSYKELGDLILAHAHSLRPGISEALIMDYFTNQRIRIKMDPQLNAPENAEKYYRKAKNEFLEIQKLNQSKETAKLKLDQLLKELDVVRLAQNFKETQGIHRGSQIQAKKQAQNTTPYKLIQWNGYEIWVGKNAKSNDELLRLASKNDLWLHVRDFTGSHVIVKQKGSKFNNEVIEKAASLAAFYSKGKKQTLVQVTYALRKFVSKSKKAAAGEVNILQESFIDVKPEDL